MKQKIESGIWRIGGSSWGLADLQVLSSDDDANVYLIKLGSAAVMIDCGMAASRRIIARNMAECGVAPNELTALVLSHSHFDHTHGARAWQERYAVPVWMNSEGARFLRRKDHRLIGYQMLEPGFKFDPFRCDKPLRDGQVVAVGDARMTALHMPGHTPDSTLYVFDDGSRRVGVCGDITFAPERAGRGELGWLCLLWLSDLGQYVKSLEKFLDIKLDLLLPGHGHAIVGEAAIRRAVRMSLATARRLRANPDTAQFGIPC